MLLCLLPAWGGLIILAKSDIFPSFAVFYINVLINLKNKHMW